MFSDPFTAIMALVLLAFIGTLAVFLRIWRELDSLRASIRELKDNTQFYAVDLAQQNRDLAVAIRDLRAASDTGQAPQERADEACLGDLLEKGLPNLVGNTAPVPMPRISLGGSTHEEDEDLIRRLGAGLGTDVSRT
ncbi:MAG: hypothetical protein DELT_00550 [Desulfovibrio sp.]